MAFDFKGRAPLSSAGADAVLLGSSDYEANTPELYLASAVGGVVIQGVTYPLREVIAALQDRLGNITVAPTVGNIAMGTLYISHRGNASLAPENTYEAYDQAIAYGCRALEVGDCNIVADGSIVIMHDDTVDRTTTSTGNVEDLTAVTAAALVVDGNSWHGSNFGNLSVPMFDAALTRYKGRALFVPEVKSPQTTAAGTAVVTALQTAGIATDQAIVQCFEIDPLVVAVAAGYPAMFLTDGADVTGGVAACKANGVDWVGLVYTAGTTKAQQYQDAGLQTVVYVVNRRYLRDTFTAVGVRGFFTDDEPYVSIDTPMRTSDAFALQTWSPGMFAGGGDTLYTESARGRFYAPDYFGWETAGSTTSFTLMGNLCPIKSNIAADDFKIRFRVKFGEANGGDTSRWAGVFIADATMHDKPYTSGGVSGEDGYLFIIRRTGTMEIFRITGATSVTLDTQASVAIAVDSEIDFAITVTPTDVSLIRYNIYGVVDATATAADTTYRGGYFHIGHNQLLCKFRHIQVTDG